MKKSISKDRQQRLLAVLKRLQVDGVEVLQEGPVVGNMAGSGTVRSLTPVPAYAMIAELQLDNPDFFSEDIARTFNQLEKRGLVKDHNADPDRPMPIIYRRRSGEVIRIDLHARRIEAYPSWPIRGEPFSRWLDLNDWIISMTVGITDGGLDVLEDRQPVQGTLTLTEAAKYLGIGKDKLRNLIEKGEIDAQDMRRPGGQRSRLTMTVGALEAFKAGRRPKPPQPTQSRRRKQAGDVKIFYK